MMFNAETDHPVDVVDKIADVLDFLSDVLVDGRPPGAELTLGPEGISGLFNIMTEIAASLRAAEKQIKK